MQLDLIANKEKEWNSDLQFNIAGPDDEPVHVSLTRYMERPPLPFFVRELAGTGTCFLFPDRFKGMASREQLLVELKLAALLCGVPLIVRSSKPPQKGQTSP